MKNDSSVEDLLDYINASPSPYHAVHETVRRLNDAGYRELDERERWKLHAGDRRYVIRGDSSICAFEVGQQPASDSGFHIVGAHTDSPNLRVKPNPDMERHGVYQLGIEVYGGVLLSTWLDRDLSLAGRVTVHGPNGHAAHGLNFDRAIMRIPNLAIHLNRKVNSDGLVINPQHHFPPIVATEGVTNVRKMLSDELARSGVSVAPDEVLGWDLCAYDVQPGVRGGLEGEYVYSARLDNLASCHAALTALLRAPTKCETTRVVVFYDHEEVGSRSAQGAASPFLRAILSRVTEATSDVSVASFGRAMARSFLVSADMAHAVHPNYADRHDTEHAPRLGEGPVIKMNANQSYATDGESWARFESYCRSADIKSQRFVVRSDLPCGSTIGPITAAELGIRTVDVGNPMLSMHSCREMAAAADVPMMIAALEAFFA